MVLCTWCFIHPDDRSETVPADRTGDWQPVEGGEELYSPDASLDLAEEWRLLAPLQVVGSISAVQRAVSKKTKELVAVRTEDKESEIGGLAREACLLRTLNGKYGTPGFPLFYHFGLQGDHHVLITQFLGPSLEQKFQECGRKFCGKTVIMIALQVLYRLEKIHGLGVVHRAINPGNIRLGIGDTETLHLTDFTQAKVYRSGDQHIPYREHTHRRSNMALYASVAEHMGAEKSRRDDLESLSFVLAYFMSGNLPWQHFEAEEGERRHECLVEAKRAVKAEHLAKGLKPLEELILYCRSLWFEANPNYSLLRKVFRGALDSETPPEGEGMFCWSGHQCSKDLPAKNPVWTSECTSLGDDRNSISTGAGHQGETLSRTWSLLSQRSCGHSSRLGRSKR